jgi:hypothetical protein
LAEFIERPGDLAGIPSGHFGLFLEAIEFLNDGDGQNHVLSGEFQHGCGIVEQNIRIQDKRFSHKLYRSCTRIKHPDVSGLGRDYNTFTETSEKYGYWVQIF